jgi:N-methylhydantoinase B
MEQEVLLPPYDVKLIAEEIKDEEIQGIPGALDMGKEDIDPVTFSVVYARIEGIMSEMTETILATARNPILHGAKDFTCTLMDARAKVLSMFDCIPVHVGTMPPPLRFLIRVFGDDIHEGDVFVNNASFAGNAHVGDFTMFAPIFSKGKFVAWAASKCHLLDIGGHAPTSMDPFAKDIYEEGYHFPAVRLCRDHKLIRDQIRFIAYNFRYPRQWYGDFLAELGSLWVGESRIIELCDRFGYETIKGCLAEMLRYGERQMVEEIKKLPSVTVEEELKSEVFKGYTPDQGLTFKMKLSIDPDEGVIEFDYSDMPDQLPFSYNLSYATANCSAKQGTLPVLSPNLPYNSGVLDRIKVKLREGAIAGIPTWPCGTEVATVGLCDEVTNLVFKTWAKVLPHRALAGMGEHPAANFCGSGVDPRNKEPYGHLHYLAASAAGGTEGFDGLPHMFGHCIMGNMGYESIEIHELAIPHIVWEVTAVKDSAGPGKWRGGVSVSHRVQPRDHDMTLIYCGTGHSWPPFGLFGGYPGTVADHWILDHETGEEVEHLFNMGETLCKPNREWYAVTGGGGGFGDPLERDPEAVKHDVRDGFVSIEAARDLYGVTIKTDSELFEVDYFFTEKLRAEMKKKREGK